MTLFKIVVNLRLRVLAQLGLILICVIYDFGILQELIVKVMVPTSISY